MKFVRTDCLHKATRLLASLRARLRGEIAWLRVYAIELALAGLIGLLCTASHFRDTVKLVSTSAQPLRDDRVTTTYTRLLSHDPITTANWLVEAIIQVESGGNSRKIGRAGERGLMQIKPGTWRDTTRRMYGAVVPFDRAFDPDMNVRVGRAYLAELQRFLMEHRKDWKSDERELLLACYNFGPYRVQRAGFDVRRLPAQVQDYVERAVALHEMFLAEQAPVVTALLQASLRSHSAENEG